MTKISTMSLGNASIAEVYRQPGSRVKVRSPLISKPELGPQEARLNPIGELPNQRDWLAYDKRQTAQKSPAPPLGGNGAQPDPVAIAGTHHCAHLADAVDQPAL